jgi:hypothetical protein
MSNNKVMALIAVGLWAVVGLLTACGDDDEDARQDLPVEAQTNDTGPMDIVVSADGFPNIGHKCKDFGGMVVGFWTTTDRTLILVYNDHACEGANPEPDMTVINGVPRAVVNAGTGG